VASTAEGENPEDGQADASTSGGSERERSGGARHDRISLAFVIQQLEIQ
jgi:hypothetical protein